MTMTMTAPQLTTIQQYITLQPGDRVLDYAAWRPTEQLLRDLGIKAVCRYIAQTTKIQGKLLTTAEIMWLHSIGIGVIPNYESYATRPNGGYSLGAIDGLFAFDWAAREGLPLECAIVASDDTNVTATTLPSHLNYQIGFDDACTAWGTGPYGDNDIMQACVDAGRSDQILWYAGARAWSGYKDPIGECHLQQTVKGSVAFKYDMNIVLRPINVWLPHKVSPRKDEDMDIFFTDGTPSTWMLMPDGTKRGLGFPVEYGLRDVGSPALPAVKVLTPDEVAQIPDYKGPVTTIPPVVLPPIPAPDLTGYKIVGEGSNLFHGQLVKE